MKMVILKDMKKYQQTNPIIHKTNDSNHTRLTPCDINTQINQITKQFGKSP